MHVQQTLTVIASDPMGNLSPPSPILEEKFALSTPAAVASELTMEEFSTVSELEADTKPPPAEKSSIKPGDRKAFLYRITKLELDRTTMKIVISDFRKKRISVQHYFNLLDRKLNELNTDAKASRTERLEIITKIKYVAKNAHPDAMQNLMKESIDLKMQKQDPI